MESVDCLVVGAGVVGLAAARALARAGREVIVVESQDCIGSGISSRNSEVIHAGVYYPTNLNKARWCVNGKAMKCGTRAQGGASGDGLRAGGSSTVLRNASASRTFSAAIRPLADIDGACKRVIHKCI